MQFKYLVVIFSAFFLSCAMAESTSYDVEQGLVKYNVFGHAHIGKDSTVAMRGNARLTFKDFGFVYVDEESRGEHLRGKLEGNHFVFKFKKRDGSRVSYFDLDSLQILEYTTIQKQNILPMEKLDYNGTISGLECEFYQSSKYHRECRHKGVVLFLEYNLLDVYYAKVATEIDFVSKIEDEHIAMPDYATNTLVPYVITLKNKDKRPKEIPEVLKSILLEIAQASTREEDIDLFVNKQSNKWKKMLFKRIFADQQEMLLSVFGKLKESRECLFTTNDFELAHTCIKPLESYIYALNLSELYGQSKFNQNSYDKLLNELSRDIFLFAPKVLCVRQSKNIDDLISCN